MYEIGVLIHPQTKHFCSQKMKGQPLEAFHLRVPCDCNPNSNTFLHSITNGINPLGAVSRVKKK